MRNLGFLKSWSHIFQIFFSFLFFFLQTIHWLKIIISCSLDNKSKQPPHWPIRICFCAIYLLSASLYFVKLCSYKLPVALSRLNGLNSVNEDTKICELDSLFLNLPFVSPEFHISDIWVEVKNSWVISPVSPWWRFCYYLNIHRSHLPSCSMSWLYPPQ